MKRLSKYLLTIGIVVLWITFTADSACGKSTVYGKYEYDATQAPLITLSLRNFFDGEEAYFAGLRYGTLPWLQTGDEVEEVLLAEETTQSETDPAAEGDEGIDTQQPQDETDQTENVEQAEDGSVQSGTDAAQAEGDAASADAGSADAGSAEIPGDGSENVVEANPDMATDTETAEGESGEENANVPEEPQVLTREVYVLSEVDDDYFCDALFIGDSRTVGLSEYCPELMERATFYAKISMTIYDFDKKEIIEVPVLTDEEAQENADSQAADGESADGTAENASNSDAGEASAESYTGEPTGDAGTTESTDASATEENQTPSDAVDDAALTEKVTIEEALNRQQFGKIYIMLGLNELGSGTPETFARNYGEVVNRIRELQPDAQIYIQGIMHVTAAKSNKDKVFKNSTIDERNAAIAELADNQHVFYINMNEATDDEEGALAQDLSFDNVHLKAKSYALWYDYLKTHAYIKTVETIQTE